MANLRYEKRLKDAQNRRMLESDLDSAMDALVFYAEGVLRGDYGPTPQKHGASVMQGSATAASKAAELFDVVAEARYHVSRSEARKIFADNSSGRKTFISRVSPLVERFVPTSSNKTPYEDAKWRGAKWKPSASNKGHYAKGRPWASIPSLKSGKKLY